MGGNKKKTLDKIAELSENRGTPHTSPAEPQSAFIRFRSLPQKSGTAMEFVAVRSGL